MAFRTPAPSTSITSVLPIAVTSESLTFSSSSHGMHSTMIAGESKQPSTSDLIKLAKHFRLNDGEKLIKNVKEVLSNWDVFAKESNVETASLKIISEANKKVK